MANMTFGVNLIPKTNNTYTLGNSDNKWNIYTNTINGEPISNYLNNYVTPEMFGAFGDGTSDDTQAIQAAIDNGNIIVFSKQYVFSSITIPDSKELIGRNGTILRNGTININGVHVSLINIELLGDNSGTGVGINVVDSRWLKLYNVNISYYEKGLSAAMMAYGVIDNCHFNNNSYAIYMNGSACGNVIISTHFNNNPCGVYYNADSNISIDSCTFESPSNGHYEIEVYSGQVCCSACYLGDVTAESGSFKIEGGYLRIVNPTCPILSSLQTGGSLFLDNVVSNTGSPKEAPIVHTGGTMRIGSNQMTGNLRVKSSDDSRIILTTKAPNYLKNGIFKDTHDITVLDTTGNVSVAIGNYANIFGGNSIVLKYTNKSATPNARIKIPYSVPKNYVGKTLCLVGEFILPDDWEEVSASRLPAIFYNDGLNRVDPRYISDWDGTFYPKTQNQIGSGDYSDSWNRSTFNMTQQNRFVFYLPVSPNATEGNAVIDMGISANDDQPELAYLALTTIDGALSYAIYE